MNAAVVRRTLDTLIQTRGEDYASISRLLGRNSTYIQQFIRRGVPRKLDEDDRRRLALHFDVPEHVLGGPPARAGRAGVARAAQGTAVDDYLLIPPLDADPDAETESALAFQARWIAHLCSDSPQALAVIRIAGDAMHPTLSHGDPALVDTADAAASLRDGIYALRVDGGIVVKRLTRNPATRAVALRSDNPAWPDWEDCAPETLDVVGRVIWVGRELR